MQKPNADIMENNQVGLQLIVELTGYINNNRPTEMLNHLLQCIVCMFV